MKKNVSEHNFALIKMLLNFAKKSFIVKNTLIIKIYIFVIIT